MMSTRVAFATGSFLIPITVLAHHSVSSWFDRQSITEVEGVLTELRWVNPHVRFTLVSTDDSGQATAWDIEALAVAGIPLSQSAEIVERFMPREDGALLDYELIVTDPATFTEPVELGKHWIWRPEIDRRPYECTVEGGVTGMGSNG